MSARSEVLRQQLQWAQAVGLAPDSRGYLEAYEPNLFRPLSSAALASFRKGSGNELDAVGDRPAKMRATHSSSALAVNVFDHWSEKPDVVLQALSLPTGAVAMHFESQFNTGLRGNPPNLDLCIRWADGTLLGIESKFTEWLTPKSKNKEHFESKYFPSERDLWSVRGMPCCQELARLIHERKVNYRYLDAPQLLKHALGLACSGQKFELCYLYFDVPGRESGAHQTEVLYFAGQVSQDFPFHVARYQDVFSRLSGLASDMDVDYIRYIKERYFDKSSPSPEGR